MTAASTGNGGDPARARERVAAAARRLAAEGLLIGTAGNVSERAGDVIAVTPTGAVLADLEAADVAVIDLGGSLVEGPLEPTSELGLHLGVYERHGAGAVVHTHSIYATTLACTVDELPAVHYMIHAFGGDTVDVSDYERFGSDELAAAVHKALGDRRGVLLRNHGAVVHGPSLSRAYDLAVLLEWLSELYWRSSIFGEPKILSHEQLEEVATEAGRRSYGYAQEEAQS